VLEQPQVQLQRSKQPQGIQEGGPEIEFEKKLNHEL
jgi:hypothetical protein